MTNAEKELFIENNVLRNENRYLKQYVEALKRRIAELERVEELENIKKATPGTGMPKSSKEKYCIKIVAQIF